MPRWLISSLLVLSLALLPGCGSGEGSTSVTFPIGGGDVGTGSPDGGTGTGDPTDPHSPPTDSSPPPPGDGTDAGANGAHSGGGGSGGGTGSQDTTDPAGGSGGGSGDFEIDLDDINDAPPADNSIPTGDGGDWTGTNPPSIAVPEPFTATLTGLALAALTLRATGRRNAP